MSGGLTGEFDLCPICNVMTQTAESFEDDILYVQCEACGHCYDVLPNDPEDDGREPEWTEEAE